MSGETKAESAAPFVPASRSLRTLACAVQECRGCPLWADATQAVFGRGPRKAELMLVGEQPGDKEDLEGEPFVGPPARELRAALELAGDRRRGHLPDQRGQAFQVAATGTRRLHQRGRARSPAG